MCFLQFALKLVLQDSITLIFSQAPQQVEITTTIANLRYLAKTSAPLATPLNNHLQTPRFKIYPDTALDKLSPDYSIFLR